MSKQKLKAFFHDPIDKPFNIKSHKEKAVEYFNLTGINEELFSEDIENSDHIAAAADRINFPKDISINFDKNAELTHPLGSGNIKISEYGYINPEYKELERVITEAIIKIKNNSKDEKIFLLSLWRNLPDIFKEYELENFKLGNLWNFLPADTRIPDHSILDHNWLVSALAGSLPNPAFLKFSIGPVQSFILSAKRTEDYWAGSYILSYLSSKAIEIVIDEIGPEHIVFPYIKGQPLIDKFLKEKYSIAVDSTDGIKIPSLPNIIFVILPYEKAKDIAIKMKDNVQKSFKELAEKIKFQFNQFFNDGKVSEIWSEQIDNFIEVYYTIYKWAKDVEDLKKQYKQIFGVAPSITVGQYPNLGNFWQCMYKISDSSFNSRKNLRSFNQLKSKDELSKCSLCGEREVLHSQDIDKTSKLTEFWRKIGQSEKGRYKIDINGRDKLCAVCFTKRMAGEYYFKENIFGEKAEINYPSTSTIAALPFKLKVVKNWHKTFPIVKNYNELLKLLGVPKNFNWNLIRYISVKVMYGENSFKPESDEFREFADFLSYDGQWIYEESFTSNFLRDYGIDSNSKKEIINGIKQAIAKISDLVDDKPSKYFAVLVMDGDKMGQWLSGTHPDWPLWRDVVHSSVIDSLDETIKEQKRNLSPALHSFISKSLNFFSLKLVKDIIEFDFPGKLIYSGGDDVLAFLPVDYVLEAAEKVRFTFSGNLDKSREIDIHHTNGYILIKDKDGKKIISTLGNKATMSAGIVIAHKNHDLSDVLRNVRSAEKEAKDIYDRDAFVIKILKHSGSITEYGSKWRYNDFRVIENINFILKNVAKEENKEGLSMSFFQSIFDDLKKLSFEDISLIKSILRLKLKRHIHLRQSQNETYEQLKERKKQLVEKIGTLFNSLITNSKKIDDFNNLLLVLRFLVTGGKR